ncbi:MAG TPA: CoA pyrophosphatase [Flavobacteriales bacterium]
MDEFIERLRKKLNGPLPGYTAHHPMMGYTRAQPSEARKMHPPAKESAVMMLLYPKCDGWHTAFMKRPDGDGAHSGQISFPGGRQELGETLEETALRETYEEVGIEPHHIEVLGQLSELFIPPSHFIVTPYVGWIPYEPVFKPNPEEVASVIEEPLSQFLRPNIILEKPIYIPKFKVYIPAKYYDLQGETLWGATAMIVQEFRTLFGYFD